MHDAACSPENEAALMQRIAQNRDAQAFDTLTEALRVPLHRFLLSQLDNNDAAASDIAQETLLRLWTRAHTWDGRGSVRHWLFRIAGNLASNHRRTIARRRESRLPGEAIPADEENDEDFLPPALREAAHEGPDAHALRTAEREQLRRLLAELPDDTRELLRLAHDEERDTRAIAAVLNVPEGTVKSRLHYTRRRLARAWNAEEEK